MTDTPQPPWPTGYKTTWKRLGWFAYFRGEPRGSSPYPSSRIDLHIGLVEGWFVEGWDAAEAHHEAKSKQPLFIMEHNMTPIQVQCNQAIAIRDLLKGFTEVVLDTRTGKHYFMAHVNGLDCRVDVEFDDPR